RIFPTVFHHGSFVGDVLGQLEHRKPMVGERERCHRQQPDCKMSKFHAYAPYIPVKLLYPSLNPANSETPVWPALPARLRGRRPDPPKTWDCRVCAPLRE